MQLDLLIVHRMVVQLVDNMQKKRDDFQVCYDSAAEIVQWANDQPGQLSKTDVGLVVKESLPVRRQRRRKSMAGELPMGEVSSASDPVKKYRVEVYSRVLDHILSSIKQRFDKTSSTLYADLSLLHPRNFGQVPPGTTEELCKYLLRFDESITARQFRKELQNLGNQWLISKQSIADAYVVQEGSDNELEHSTSPLSITYDSCKPYPICCYKVLLQLNLFADADKGHFTGLAYKLLLTLPVFQVTCEGSFSALKRIENRQRSTMTQEHLEAFMLMSVKKGILAKLDNKGIIDSVAASSELRSRRHLLC